MGRASRRKRLPKDIRNAHPPAYKLSEALINLVEPWKDADDESCIDGHRNLIAMAAFAWNLTLLSDDQREENLRKIVDEISQMIATKKASFVQRVLRRGRRDTTEYPVINATITDLLTALMARKKALYPSDRRFVAHFDLAPTFSGYHLTVASTVVSNDVPAQMLRTG
jgi:hypothetical protein